MIKGLRIKNWRSHLDTDIDFRSGTNVLVGAMGTGKSSVLSAISFALFGTFPSHRSREVRLDDMIMDRPEKKGVSEIELTFALEGNQFRVRRRIERGKGTTEADIYKNGEHLDTGSRRVTEIVEKNLKMDFDLFSRAVYSEQDNIDNFLEIRKGERMKKIDELLRINRFERCRGNTTTLINRLEERTRSRRKMLEELEKQEDFKRLGELKQSLEKTKDEITEISSELQETKKRYRKNEKDIKELKNEIKSIKELKNEKNTLEGAISSIKDDIKYLSSKINIQRKNIIKGLEIVKERIIDLKNDREDIKKHLDKLKDSEREKRADIKNLQKGIQKIKEVEGRCPVCNKKTDKEHRKQIVEKRRRSMGRLADERDGINREIDSTEERLERISDKIEEAEDVSRDLRKRLEYSETVEKKKKTLQEKKEELGKLEEEIKRLDSKLKTDELEERRGTLNSLSGKKKELEERIEGKRQIMKNKEDELERLNERKKRFEGYKKEIERSEAMKQDLAKFRKALKSTQRQLRDKFIDSINNTLSEIWKELYPYEDFSDIRFMVCEDDCELQLKNTDGWGPVEGMASGGERTSACLALRIAFSLVLAPNLKWLVLDEPTHNLDKMAVRDLSELLGNKITEFVEQVFLITHNGIMENAASGCLYRLERDKQTNEPTKTIEIM